MAENRPAISKEPIRVLVVEDEALVRTLAVEFFADRGFDVLEARDADVALGILQTEAARIQVIFTDVRMPGLMDGMTLANYARRNWPWIKVVVTSGFITWKVGELPRDVEFVHKPYKLTAIESHIRRITQ